MQLSAAYRCVALIGQTVGKLPLQFFRKMPDGSREPWESPLSVALTIEPNDDQTASEFLSGAAAWVASQGNAFAEKIELGGEVIALRPLPNCQPYRRPADGALEYHLYDRGRLEILPRAKVFHVRGLTMAGDLGVSPIVAGVNSLGNARAAEVAAGSMFQSGMQPGGFLAVDATLNKEQRAGFEDILDRFTGSDRFGKAMVLDKRMTWTNAQFNAADSQLLESRRFGIEEICRWWGVPPILVGHSAQGQTMWGSGVEQIILAWLFSGLDPYLVAFEDRIRASLIPRDMRGTHYAEFNREALLVMDTQAKASFLSQMWQNGGMTRNEGRAKLNLPRVEGGDELTVQSNLVPLTALGATQAAGAETARNAVRSWLGIEDKGNGEAKPSPGGDTRH